MIDSKDSRRHVDWLLDRVEIKADVISQLQQKGYSIRISCMWDSKHGHGGPTVSVEECERLAQIGNGDIDHYRHLP